MKTHIPDVSTGRTYCGRDLKSRVRVPDQGEATIPIPCIDLSLDCIEDATCTACHRSDDRRQAEAHRSALHTQAIRGTCGECHGATIVERYRNGKSGARGLWCSFCEEWR